MTDKSSRGYTSIKSFVNMTCTAIVKGERIELNIRKEDEGYKYFVNVLNNIEKHGLMSWYGDIVNQDGKEQVGLIITNKPIELNGGGD